MKKHFWVEPFVLASSERSGSSELPAPHDAAMLLCHLPPRGIGRALLGRKPNVGRFGQGPKRGKKNVKAQMFGDF